jgi:hypothetical protein
LIAACVFYCRLLIDYSSDARRIRLWILSSGQQPRWRCRSPNASRSIPEPASSLQRKFEQVKLLPPEKQKFTIQFLDTVLESSQQKQKA